MTRYPERGTARASLFTLAQGLVAASLCAFFMMLTEVNWQSIVIPIGLFSLFAAYAAYDYKRPKQ